MIKHASFKSIQGRKAFDIHLLQSFVYFLTFMPNISNQKFVNISDVLQSEQHLMSKELRYLILHARGGLELLLGPPKSIDYNNMDG